MYKFVIVKRKKNVIKKEELFNFGDEKLVSLIEKYNNSDNFRLTKDVAKKIINDDVFLELKKSNVKEEKDFYDALKMLSKVCNMFEIWLKKED